MKKIGVVFGSLLMMIFMGSVAFSAYHHEGEIDSPNFLAQYPEKAGTKLDHCATCHTGGEYEKNGKMVSLGSCQWCHHSYGYDGSGNIVDTLNSYGKDYYTNGRSQAALAAIEGLDSDKDGYSNLTEIQADKYPGIAGDDPSKVPAPSRVYSKAQLEAMTQHTQFMLMNTARSGDFYVEYTGVPVEDLLEDAGILDSATGITVFAPDGWSNYHPLEEDADPELYHVRGLYPQAQYYYDIQADQALNPLSGWCDYSAPSCSGRNHQDLITNTNGLKMLLAFKREGQDLIPGILADDNKLDGEGPFRLVPPQKVPSAPDQASNADDQDVTWPYNYDWDHSAGAASRSATIIRVEPLPEGTTDIDILEAGWDYVDDEKIVIYGAIEDLNAPVPSIRINGQTGTVAVASGDTVSVTVNLDSGSRTGQIADWWVAATYGSGDELSVISYVPPSGWVLGLSPCVQGGLMDLSTPVTVFAGILPVGAYDFYFAIDSNTDGLPDATWYDKATVNVQ